MIQLQPMRTWDSLLQRSLYHAQKLHGFAEASQSHGGVLGTCNINRNLSDDEIRGSRRPVA
jgi:membrane dipeptidase